MASGTGKRKKLTDRRRFLKGRKAGIQRKRKESKRSTRSYEELFGEPREEFEAKFAGKAK